MAFVVGFDLPSIGMAGFDSDSSPKGEAIFGAFYVLVGHVVGDVEGAGILAPGALLLEEFAADLLVVRVVQELLSEALIFIPLLLRLFDRDGQRDSFAVRDQFCRHFVSSSTSISAAPAAKAQPRSEERRVGKECRSRWS